MATRMQQRRGTAAQWISTNSGNGPILSPGELGFESDTNKFKIGDGVNHWIDLTYFTDAESITTALNNIIDGAPAALNTLNELAAALGDDPNFLSNLATEAYVDTAVSGVTTDITAMAGTGLDWNASTDQFDIDSTVATKAFAANLLTNATKSNITITGDENGLTITAENGVADSNTDNLTEGSTNKYFTDERAQDAVGNSIGSGLSYNDSTGAISVDTTAIQARVADVSDTEIGYLNGVTSAIQTQIDSKAPLASPTFTGTATTNHLIVDGDFTVNGTNFAASATSITIEDNIVQIAHNNPANTVDLGLVVGYNDGTAKHAGLVKDTSDNTWKLFKGVTTEPSTTVDFTQGSLDDLTLNAITASSITVGNVSNTEFGYLNGVTSAIQTQIDTKSPIDSPTFTGTVSGITKSMVGLGSVDNTSDADKPVSSATQTALDLKANLSSPTFTGTVVLPTGTVTSGMILDGTIVNADINASAAISLSKLASGTSAQIIVANSSGVPTYVAQTGDVTISNAGVTAIASGVIVNADINASAAIAQSKIANLTTDLAAKAPLASPTFTGTVTIPAGASISGFAPLASPALTGTPTAPTAVSSTNTTQVATTAFVRSVVADINSFNLILDGGGVI